MADLEYPGRGDHVLVIVEPSDRFLNGTVHGCDSLTFTVRESWTGVWRYADFGVTWLWDDGAGRVVDRRALTEEDLAARRLARGEVPGGA